MDANAQNVEIIEYVGPLACVHVVTRDTTVVRDSDGTLYYFPYPLCPGNEEERGA